MKDCENVIVEAQPVPQDNSKLIEEVEQCEIEKEKKKQIANDSTIEIKELIKNSEKTSKKHFIITVVLTILMLLVAITTLIVTIKK